MADVGTIRGALVGLGACLALMNATSVLHAETTSGADDGRSSGGHAKAAAAGGTSTSNAGAKGASSKEDSAKVDSAKVDGPKSAGVKVESAKGASSKGEHSKGASSEIESAMSANANGGSGEVESRKVDGKLDGSKTSASKKSEKSKDADKSNNSTTSKDAEKSKDADKTLPTREPAGSPSRESAAPSGVPARRRGASSATTRLGVASEVEGGTSGHRSVRPPTVQSASKSLCLRDAIEFERGFGGDTENVVLTRCDGRSLPNAIEQLSILVRPMNVVRPSPLASRIRRAAHHEWLPGVKRIHEGLITRLQAVIDRFHPKKITLVSGYRPASLGSFHQSARALDVHVEGVANEALVEFCRTLGDTGCGYYPNSSFVHIDVRPTGTGHVHWIDASGPGEPARYVSSWPPSNTSGAVSSIARPDPAAPTDEQTHSTAGVRPPMGGNDAKIDARTTAPWWSGDNVFSP